ncbi:hypothetical protein BD626DRAFT_494670 [Schizophyllum amplum]|uniref:Uncharacterized protein n=1 Tax=Schizophyllum amplum TaxID=97359 RepID=A0A550CFI1_9AGAR|nr:hypothetical protein BD626DRAFT_494670 [Auriculariopsis ampla]
MLAGKGSGSQLDPIELSDDEDTHFTATSSTTQNPPLAAQSHRNNAPREPSPAVASMRNKGGKRKREEEHPDAFVPRPPPKATTQASAQPTPKKNNKKKKDKHQQPPKQQKQHSSAIPPPATTKATRMSHAGHTASHGLPPTPSRAMGPASTHEQFFDTQFQSGWVNGMSAAGGSAVPPMPNMHGLPHKPDILMNEPIASTSNLHASHPVLPLRPAPALKSSPAAPQPRQKPPAAAPNSKKAKARPMTIGQEPDPDAKLAHGCISSDVYASLAPWSPDPERTLIMEFIPKVYRANPEWVSNWALSVCGVAPFVVTNRLSKDRAIIEFPSNALALSAWRSKRMNADLEKLRSESIKGQPRVDFIRVYWLVVNGQSPGYELAQRRQSEAQARAQAAAVIEPPSGTKLSRKQKQKQKAEDNSTQLLPPSTSAPLPLRVETSNLAELMSQALPLFTPVPPPSSVLVQPPPLALSSSPIIAPLPQASTSQQAQAVRPPRRQSSVIYTTPTSSPTFPPPPQTASLAQPATSTSEYVMSSPIRASPARLPASPTRPSMPPARQPASPIVIDLMDDDSGDSFQIAPTLSSPSAQKPTRDVMNVPQRERLPAGVRPAVDARATVAARQEAEMRLGFAQLHDPSAASSSSAVTPEPMVEDDRQDALRTENELRARVLQSLRSRPMMQQRHAPPLQPQPAATLQHRPAPSSDMQSPLSSALQHLPSFALPEVMNIIASSSSSRDVSQAELDYGDNYGESHGQGSFGQGIYGQGSYAPTSTLQASTSSLQASTSTLHASTSTLQAPTSAPQDDAVSFIKMAINGGELPPPSTMAQASSSWTQASFSQSTSMKRDASSLRTADPSAMKMNASMMNTDKMLFESTLKSAPPPPALTPKEMAARQQRLDKHIAASKYYLAQIDQGKTPEERNRFTKLLAELNRKYAADEARQPRRWPVIQQPPVIIDISDDETD